MRVPCGAQGSGVGPGVRRVAAKASVVVTAFAGRPAARTSTPGGHHDRSRLAAISSAPRYPSGATKLSHHPLPYPTLLKPGIGQLTDVLRDLSRQARHQNQDVVV